MPDAETNMSSDARLTEIRFDVTKRIPLVNLNFLGPYSAAFILSYGPFVRDVGYFISFRPRRWSRSGPEFSVYGSPRLNDNDTYSTIRFSFLISTSDGEKKESFETEPRLIRDNNIVLDKSSEFMCLLLNEIESNQYTGGYLQIGMHLIYDANAFFEFTQDEFYASANGGKSPLSDHDLRMAARIDDITRDCSIRGTDGSMESSKCLLFLSSTFMKKIIRLNPAVKVISVPFNKRVIEKALNAILTASIDVSDMEIDEACRLIELIRMLDPIRKVSMAHHVELRVRTKLREQWNQMKLSEWMTILEFAMDNRCHLIILSTVSVIADNFYAQFKSEYNENSSGENLRIFEKLSGRVLESAPDDMSLYNRLPWLNAIEKIDRQRLDQFKIQRTFTLRNSAIQSIE